MNVIETSLCEFCEDLPIRGIGIDLCAISRFEKLFSGYSPNELLHVYTQNELERNLNTKEAYFNLAIIFSSKEAVAKCMGVRFGSGVCWNFIEIFINKQNKFEVRLHAQMIKIAKQNGIESFSGFWSVFDTNFILTCVLGY